MQQKIDFIVERVEGLVQTQKDAMEILEILAQKEMKLAEIGKESGDAFTTGLSEGLGLAWYCMRLVLKNDLDWWPGTDKEKALDFLKSRLG